MPTTTFATLGWNVFTVPSKVTSLTVALNGGSAGSRPGGRVTGKLAVTPGQKVYCHVGGAGKSNSGATGGAQSNGSGAAGGNGRTQAGGDGGGGYSALRIGSTTGTLKAVAGGAGGDSGDGGAGGMGGGPTGQHGFPSATSDLAPIGDATGGTQSQGGNGGTSSIGSQFNGQNASDTVVATAGAGGSAGSGTNSHGGGGGGGGYHPGGGGQASAVSYARGGGGGGGSSYTGGLTSPVDTQGGAVLGNGSVVITWITPPPANAPPNPPSEVKVNSVDAASGMLTKATTSVKITAKISDPNGKNVRLQARFSASPTFSPYSTVTSGWVASGKTTTITLAGLSQNTRYYVRLYTQDTNNLYSVSYNSIDFWTNKAPLAPDGLSVNTQGSGMSLPSLSSATFKWVHNDEDVADYQTAFNIQYRKSATSTAVPGAWTSVAQYLGQNFSQVVGPPSSAVNEWVFDPGTFKGNTFYEWQIRTRDGQNLWGAWSALFDFRATSTTAPPILLIPPNSAAVDVHAATTFGWRFVDPDTGDAQLRADFRYRAARPIQGVAPDPLPEWVLLAGAVDPGVPGGTQTWVIPAETFTADYVYEWQVRTYDTSGGPASEWSDSSSFYAIGTPGSESGPLPVGGAVRPQGSLGCGTYRVFVYEQGGKRRLGELDPISLLRFTRLRDDISACSTFSSGYSDDCGALYASVRCWMHELVVFRDGVRVWEGPITRIAYTADQVEFEAKDVMAYVYRRVLRVGYNDAYRLIKAGVGGLPDEYLGLLSVVRRAAMLVTQALAPYDPNVLPYLTSIEYPDDARESRVIANWSRSAWEEVDDLAATAGLDYTTVGRRILLWDTHRAIGRLPELRDGDFSNSAVVTEYGMQLATFFAVTNGSGVVGTAEVPAGHYPYGPIEHLASSYSDSTAAGEEVQTPEQLAKAQESMTEQAQRNLSGRWPSPLIVRIPDNSTLSPDANVGFQQLIPGVWLPLRSVNTPREVVQWQKLDSVAVEYDEKGEKVNVVMSPAPNGGNDPDTDVAEPGD